MKMNGTMQYPGNRITVTNELMTEGLRSLGAKFVGLGWICRTTKFTPTVYTTAWRRQVRETLALLPRKYRAWAIQSLRNGAQTERKMRAISCQ